MYMHVCTDFTEALEAAFVAKEVQKTYCRFPIMLSRGGGGDEHVYLYNRLCLVKASSRFCLDPILKSNET